MASEHDAGINVAGELDPSFAIDGRFEVPTSTGEAVALIADTHSLTVAMNAGMEFCLCRVDANGVLDSSFANQGWLKWKFDDGGGSSVWRLLLQADKKIVVIGASYSSQVGQPAVTRLNPGGSPDLVFGRKVLQVFPESQIGITRIRGCLQADGKILLCGGYSSRTGNGTLLIRLLPDGNLDSSFGIEGVAQLFHPYGRLYVSQVAVQSQGRILVAGDVANQGYVAGINQNGDLDTSYGEQGFSFSGRPGATYSFSDMLLRGDGSVRCVGGTGDAGALVVGLDQNGQPDQAFNGGQPVETPELLGRWVCVSEQADSKLLVAGHSGRPDLEQVSTRFTVDGTIDASYGWSGFMYHPGGPADSVLQSGGRWITTAYHADAPSAWLYGIATKP